MSTTPKIRKSRVGIVDGTEMGVLEIHENLPPGSRCVGTIAMVTRDWVAAPTTISWMMDDRSYLGPGEHSQRYIIQGNVLVHQRNECINKMDGDWILFIDSDMVFQPGAVKTLVETQKKFDLDIVGGLCFQRTPPTSPRCTSWRQTPSTGTRFWRSGLMTLPSRSTRRGWRSS